MKKTNSNNISQLTDSLSSIDVQQLLLSRAKNSVLATAVELMEQDMERLCGAAFTRKSDADLCHRGGSEKTSLLLDGAKYSLRRPRARKGGEEVELPSLEKMREIDLLDSQMLLRIMKGVSTRNYSELTQNSFSFFWQRNLRLQFKQNLLLPALPFPGVQWAKQFHRI